MSIHFSKPFKKISEKSPLIIIVASEYNNHLVEPMLEQAQEEVSKLEKKALIKVIRVPGAFEIPLFVKFAAEHDKPDAIIALGVLLQGETGHADLIANTVSLALMNLSLEYSVPVIHQVLFLKHEEQAIDRCINESMNRGVEGIRIALAAIDAKKSLQHS